MFVSPSACQKIPDALGTRLTGDEEKQIWSKNDKEEEVDDEVLIKEIFDPVVEKIRICFSCVGPPVTTTVSK